MKGDMEDRMGYRLGFDEHFHQIQLHHGLSVESEPIRFEDDVFDFFPTALRYSNKQPTFLAIETKTRSPA